MDQSTRHSFILNLQMCMNLKEAWRAKLILTHAKRVDMHKETSIDEDVLMLNQVLCTNEHGSH